MIRFRPDPQAVVERFVRLERELTDLRTPLRTIAEDVVAATAETIDRGGTDWPPLSPAYAAWKQQHFPGRPMLVATGSLRRAIESGAAWRTTLSKTSLEMVVTNPQLAGHHFGARPVFDEDEGQRDHWLEVLEDHVVRGVQRSFAGAAR